MFSDSSDVSPKPMRIAPPSQNCEAEKEFDIAIEGDAKGPFEPQLLSVMCVSPRQVYGSGPIFKAIFRHLYESGAKTLMVLPHTLEEHNFGVEFNDVSDSNNESLAPKISQRLKKSWLEVNFDSDPEMCRMRQEMEEKGRLEFLDWEECKEKFKEELKQAEEGLTQEDKDACDKTAYANAKLFYQKAREKHFSSNPMFQAACLKGEDHVIEAYKKYSLAEIFMGKAWKQAGITQVLYPKDYYLRLHSKNPNPDNIDLFQCIGSEFDGSIRLCNIKVTPHEFVPKSERRKASADERTSQQQHLIGELKIEKRDLQSKVGNLAAHLAYLKEVKKKLEEDKLNIQWSHSTDVQALTEAMLEYKNQANQAEEENMRNVEDLSRKQEEVASANTIIDELKSSNQLLESQVIQLMTEIVQMEEELETVDSRFAELEVRETALRDEAALMEAQQKELEIQQKELEAKTAALAKQRLEFLEKKAGMEKQRQALGEKKGVSLSAPTLSQGFFSKLPDHSTVASVQSRPPLVTPQLPDDSTVASVQTRPPL